MGCLFAGGLSGATVSAAINSPTNALGTVGLPFSYQISSTDPATNKTYAAADLPSGILLTNSNTGLVTGLPQVAGVFTSSVTTISDGETNSTNVLVTVNPPASPVLASPQTFFGMQGEPLRYALLSVPNHSNVPTTFAVSNLPAGATLISNVTTNALYTNVSVTNYFINAASLAGNGSFVVPVVTRNQGGTNTNNVTFVISPSTAPVITSTNTASGIVGVPFSFDVTAINSPLRFRVTSVQLGTNTPLTGLNITNGVLTNGLSFSNVAIGSYVVGRISGTPATATNVTLGLEAINNTLTSATQTLTINVGPPQPTVILTKPLGENFFATGSSFFANAQAFDRLPDAIVPSSVSFTADGTAVPGIIGRLGDNYGVEFYPGSELANPFNLTVSAQNNLGQSSSFSLSMFALPPISAFPEIEMLPLLPGPQIQAGGTATLRARATSAQTPIQRVEFYVNKVYVGFTTAPVAGTVDEYQVEWDTPAEASSFEINARVISQNGLFGDPGTPYYASVITRTPVLLNTIPGVLPSVSIVTPANGAQLPFNVATRVVASANVFGGSIQQVQFYVDGRPLGAADNTAPYTVDFTPASYGTYQLFAIATSSAGLVNISPTVTVTVPELQGGNPTVERIKVNNADAPTHDAQTGQTLVFTTDADDQDGNVVNVEFLANGVALPSPDAEGNPNPDLVAPYRYVFAPSAPGRYELVARATDNSGNVTDSEPTILFVSVGTPPSIGITAPVQSAPAPAPVPVYDMLINQSVTIRAMPVIAELGRNVQQVEFLFNEQLIATLGPLAVGESYNLQWRADNTGRYRIVARVTDNLGNIADSPPIEINVTQGDAPNADFTITGAETAVEQPGLQMQRDGDNLVFTFERLPGVTYTVEETSDLRAGIWTPQPDVVFTRAAVQPNDLPAGYELAQFTTSIAGAGPRKFYRLSYPEAVSDGTVAKVNETIVIEANASGVSGALARVELVVNGVVVASLTQGPYRFDLPLPNAGLYEILIRAIDDLGNVTDSARQAVFANFGTPPTVSLSTPAEGEELTPNVPVSLVAAATGNGASITEVQFLVNGQPAGVSTATPFVGGFTPNSVGQYTILVRATDSLGNVSEVRRVLQAVAPPDGVVPPLVLLNQPLGDTRLVTGSRLYFNAEAKNADGTVDPDMQVRFFVNGIVQDPDLIETLGEGVFSMPFVIADNNFTYVVQAVATDGAGIRSASSPVTIVSAAPRSPAPPAPVISPLAPGTPQAAGGDIRLRAAVNFPVTAVNPRLEFYANGVYLGDGTLDTDGTFFYDWGTPEAVLSGIRITARAVADNFTFTTGTPPNQQQVVFLGATLSSNFITINTQQGVAPTVRLELPVEGSTATLGQPLTLRAAAAGSPGVSRIDVTAGGSGYSSAPVVEITGGGGADAEAIAVVENGAVVEVIVTAAGTGYTSTPTVSFTGGGGSDATATAFVSTPTVAGVRFFVNGAELPGGPFPGNPYETTFTPQSQGTYIISAVAVGVDGLVSAPDFVVVVVPVAAAPVVTISNPPEAAKYPPGTTIPISATATPPLSNTNARVVSMQFFVDGVSVPSSVDYPNPDTQAPFLAQFQVPGQGPFKLTAIATDNFGNVGASSVSIEGKDQTAGQETFINLTHPVVENSYSTASDLYLNATVIAPTNLTVGTNDVTFFINGQAYSNGLTKVGNIFGVYWRPSSEDFFTVSAQVKTTNNGINIVSPPQRFTIGELRQSLPSIQMLPLANTNIRLGSTTYLQATVNGGLSDVDRVDFYADQVFLGSVALGFAADNEDVLALFPWKPTTASGAAGFKITARAIQFVTGPDNSVISTNSFPLVVEGPASGLEPVVTLAQTPIAERNYVIGSELFLNATAVAQGSATINTNSIQFFYRGQTLTSTNGVASSGVFAGTNVVYTARVPVQSTALANFVFASAKDSSNNLGNSDTAQINSAAPLRALPAVQMLAKLPGQPEVAGGFVTLRAQATFPGSASQDQRVEFYANGAFVGVGTNSTTQPDVYSLQWQTPTNANSFLINARAVDLNFDTPGGQNGPDVEYYSSVISDLPIPVNTIVGSNPVVSVTFPANNAEVPVNVPTFIRANASVSGSNIKEVRFYADGVQVGAPDTDAPYEVAFTPASPGPYQVYAIAETISGVIGFSTPAVVVNAVQGDAPTVTLTSPATTPSSVAVNSTVVLAADADDTDGSVVSVTFLANGVPLPGGAGGDNPDLVAPYRYNFTPTSAGRYEIVARAIDDLGNVTDSVPVVVNANIGTPPTVTIVSPVETDTMTPGVPVSIVAAVEGKSGTVTQVEFFVNDISSGTVVAEPFATAFTPPAVGPYVIFARATDSLGNVTDSAKVSLSAVAAGANQPLVAVSQPPSGVQLVGGSQFYFNVEALTADGSIDPGMTVEFFATLNGALFRPVETSVLDDSFFAARFDINAPGGLVSTVAVYAVATDSLGNRAATPPVVILSRPRTNTLPEVQILDPLPGTNPASKGGVVTLRARATFPAVTSAAQSVEFYANGVFIGEQPATGTGVYSFDWRIPSDLVDDSVRITARAVAENFGNAIVGSNLGSSLSANAPVALNLQPGVLPQPAITFPAAAGTIPVGVATEIRATVPVLPSGSITNVDFYANGRLIGSDTTAPYIVPWTPESTGLYSLAAVATSTFGIEGVSASGYSVSVTSGLPPTVNLTSPATTPSSVAVNSTVVLAADADDTDGSVVSVTFLANGVPLPATAGDENPDTVAPYRYNFIPVSAGRYEIVARAIDDLGNVTDSAPVVVNANIGTPPVVEILSPDDGDQVPVGIAVPVFAEASSPTGSVASVQLLVNGVVVGTDNQSPYIFVDPGQFAGSPNTTFTPPSEGVYRIVARATDNLGNVTDSLPVVVTARAQVVDGDAPQVVMTQPVGEIYYTAGSEMFVNARATDADQPAGVDLVVNFTANGLTPPPGGTVKRLGNVYGTRYSPTEPFVIESLRATATDDRGNTTQSQPIFTVISIAQGPLPSVEMLPLLPETPEVAGGEILLRARAVFPPTANQEARVEFYANNVYVGTATPDGQDPTLYTFEWKTPATAGAYVVEARAIAENWRTNVGEGNVIQIYGSVISDNSTTVNTAAGSVPEVVITNPAANEVLNVNQSYTVRATAEAADGSLIERVEFYANGQLLGVDNSSPYEAPLTPLSVGLYNLSALAYTESGLVGTAQTVTVSAALGSAPTVTLSVPDVLPLGGLSELVVNAQVTETGRNIVRVEFIANNVVIHTATEVNPDAGYSYTFDWQVLSPGNYNLQARAYDNVGNVGFSAILNRNTVIAPDVTLTATNTNGQPVTDSLTGQVIILTATAATSQPGASIAEMEFAYEDGELLTPLPATDAIGNPNPQLAPAYNSPFTYYLRLTRTGVNRIVAVATDDTPFAVSGLSNTVEITVQPDPDAPVINFVTPLDGESVQTGQPLRIEVTATPGASSVPIGRVDFTVTNPDGSIAGPLRAPQSASPYSILYEDVTLPGTYAITATATAGGSTIAKAIIITAVQRPVPPPGTDLAFIDDMFRLLFYRFPTDDERDYWYDWLGSQDEDALAPLSKRADMVMELMGFDAAAQTFANTSGFWTPAVASYQATSAMALQPFGRLGITPTKALVEGFLAPLAADVALNPPEGRPLPLTGEYSLIPGAPYGATYGMAAGMQSIFASTQFSAAYPNVLSLDNLQFVDWLSDVMFENRAVGNVFQVSSMMDTFDPQTQRQGAAGAFLTKFVVRQAASYGYLNPDSAAEERAFQLKLNSASLKFQLNDSGAAFWNYAVAPNYSKPVVEEYIQQYWDAKQ